MIASVGDIKIVLLIHGDATGCGQGGSDRQTAIAGIVAHPIARDGGNHAVALNTTDALIPRVSNVQISVRSKGHAGGVVQQRIARRPPVSAKASQVTPCQGRDHSIRTDSADTIITEISNIETAI
jgi:hypothetical protein